MAESLRAKSRRDWSSDDNTNENIQLGCMLRIADATEKMAQRHTELMRDRDQYERWHREETARRKIAERQLSATKGQITKLRNKLAQIKVQA